MTGVQRFKLWPATSPSWTDEAKTELHLLSMNLHDLSVEVTQRAPTIALIVEGYAKRIDELMKRAPR